jgi:hypothetical protein
MKEPTWPRANDLFFRLINKLSQQKDRAFPCPMGS